VNRHKREQARASEHKASMSERANERKGTVSERTRALTHDPFDNGGQKPHYEQSRVTILGHRNIFIAVAQYFKAVF